MATGATVAVLPLSIWAKVNGRTGFSGLPIAQNLWAGFGLSQGGGNRIGALGLDLPGAGTLICAIP